jgi:hypothetical protein
VDSQGNRHDAENIKAPILIPMMNWKDAFWFSEVRVKQVWKARRPSTGRSGRRRKKELRPYQLKPLIFRQTALISKRYNLE